MSTESSLNQWGAFPSRREVLRHGLLGTVGLMLANRLGARAAGPSPTAKAKAVIQVWLWGGPCHVDTFDPKPSAGNDITGPLTSPITGKVPGIQISELLP